MITTSFYYYYDPEQLKITDKREMGKGARARQNQRGS